MESKIIQIIPAPADLIAVYQDEGEKVFSKVLCIALKDNGDITLLDIDSSGLIDEVESAANYEGVKWKSGNSKEPENKKWDDERW